MLQDERAVLVYGDFFKVDVRTRMTLVYIRLARVAFSDQANLSWQADERRYWLYDFLRDVGTRGKVSSDLDWHSSLLHPYGFFVSVSVKCPFAFFTPSTMT